MIKVNHYNKAAPEYIHEKKDKVAKKMKKGKESLNPAQKNRNDFEGQKSYKQEDT